MDEAIPFGAWLRQRRKALDLTRDALGRRVGCSGATIAKIEAGQRRPSQQIAERLAAALDIAAGDRDAFMRRARRVPDDLPALPEAAPPPETHISLPAPPTPLVGREQDARQVAQQLQRKDVRLLTLTGPPGVGKTRLSLEVAHLVAPAFRDGAAFISLAAVRDPALVPDTIARALDAHEQAGVPSLERLVLALGQRHMLIVLDNFEQVVDAAPALARILSACHGVTLLVTSRERLRVRGEHQFRVGPLPLPELDQIVDPASIVQAPAVQLFVQVARAADPSFQITAANADDVAAICTRLDGLPLAIELVAAQCDTLPLPALLARLDRHLLASEGPRDLPERQRTLGAALDWSYALLTEDERRLLRRLGVFVGAWSAEAVAQVCASDDLSNTAAHEQLGALASKSLVQHTASASGEPSFTLLETIRAYALEALERSGEAEQIRGRHASYYCALAGQAATQLRGDAQQLWVARLRHAYDNIHAAFDWLIACGDVEQAGRLCAALRRFWWMRGSYREGRDWVARVLAHGDKLAPLTRAGVYIADGMLASAYGNLPEGIAAFEVALDLGRLAEDAETIGIAAHNLGNMLLGQGENERGRALLELSLEIDRATGDQWGLAVSLGSLGELCYDQGDYAAARAYYSESLAIYRQHGDHNSIALTLNNLGEIARRQHDLDTAQTFLFEGLALARAHDLRRILSFLYNNLSIIALHHGELEQAQRHLREAVAVLHETGGAQALDTSLLAAVMLAHRTQQPALAATLLGAAQALREAHDIRLSLSEQAEFDAQLEQARATLTPNAFDAAWAAGQRLSIAEVLQILLEIT